MKTFRVRDSADLRTLQRRLQNSVAFSESETRKVRLILQSVRRRGDAALLAYARRFDSITMRPADLRVTTAEVRSAYSKAGKVFVKAAQAAINNIKQYQERLRPLSWRRTMRPGVVLGQLVRPMRRVGLYVPGGEAPLVSTVMMTAVPAKVAGVEEIALCTPDRGKGIDPRILVAADLAGVKEVYRVGGAQAIGALAYGTRSIPAVDMIAGPGNRWVVLAKKLVFGDVGIDMLPGPSEALVVADDSASATWVAWDLLSQAEHAGDETAILVTPSQRLAKAVSKELALRLKTLPRRAIATRSLKKFGLIVLVKDLESAMRVVNLLAPEHLQLMVRQPDAWLPKVRNAGAIFVGAHTPVALGDFIAGPSHVLPTGGTARFASGLSVVDFMTSSSIVRYERSALEQAEEELVPIAQAEGLSAHRDSLLVRRGKA